MNKHTTLITLFFILLFNHVKAECVLVPLPLAERVLASNLIVEAKVTQTKSYWNADHTIIFTANTIAVSKVYKGLNLLPGNSFNIITLGGTVNDQSLKVEPELELAAGDMGIFMLIEKDGRWVAESGPQGFIRLDKIDGSASDIFNHYPPFTIYSLIENLTQLKPTDINAGLTKIQMNVKRAAATVTSISPKTITAGTTSTLTIKGTNFKSTRDTSSVLFKNADDGGLSYIKALKLDYIYWSDTMIRLIVRTKAGTGKIRVLIGGNGMATSTDTLQVTYAHLNVVSGFNNDSLGAETQEIGMNATNGITWKISKRFYDSIGAKGAFIRSLERWRCGTYMNWDTLGTVNYSTIKSDGVNMCAWDTSGAMPSGVLAQCFSFWNGCFVGPTIKWFVSEMDIRFRIKPTSGTNWNYTLGSASATQYHFETVATHELGHGHQLGHVIAPAVVMHYSIANGQVKPGLTSSDINGGGYVITKSATAICSKNAHAKLNAGNCAIVTPSVNFTMSKSTVCLNGSVSYQDSSKGNITAYSWNFGAGASPATANTIGPHNVTYATGGTKTISLTITTSTSATLNKQKTILVQADSKMKPDFSWVASEKGKVTFTNTSNNPVSSKWYFGDMDSSASTSPQHVYSTGGSFNVRMLATNTCNTEDTIKSIKFAYLNFYALPKNACIGQTVTYYDSSDNNVSSWQWTLAGASPPAANTKGPHKVTYNSAGSKNATLMISVAGGQNQTYTINNITTISTDTFVKADFSFGYYGSQIVGFTNTSTGSNKTYKWYFGDGDSSTLMNPVHRYSNANNKVVRLVVNGTCNTDDTTHTLRDFTGISAIQNQNMFTVYPNPVNAYFNIKSAVNSDLNLEITDVSGKVIRTAVLDANQAVYTGEMANGVYFVKVSANGFTSISKLVIQH